MTRNEPRANATTKPSSRWPGAGQMSCSRCSETAPSMNPAPHNLLQQLDGKLWKHSSRRGNKVLKRILFLSAFAFIKGDRASSAYYDKKRAEGKHQYQDDIALARRRSIKYGSASCR